MQLTQQLRNSPERTEIDEASVVYCPVDELKPHPSYARHRISVNTAKFAALTEQGDLAFKYPLIVTRERLIIDGYGRWELAKKQGRPTLPCVEYDLNERDALLWLIQTHRRSHALNDFIRIQMALDLEPHFKQIALWNTQEGGRLKGLSNLTTAERVNSRIEIARAAHVSVGNVHKG